MKLVVPLTNAFSYEKLVEAGADEFFCGFLPVEWLLNEGIRFPINRRTSFYSKTSVTSMNEMIKLAKLKDIHKKPVKITFNALFYSPTQYNLIEKIMLELIDLGFSTFIVCDIGLLVWIKQKQLPCDIHISGSMSFANRMAIDFYKQFNVERFIFPRKTSLDEMQSCICNNLHIAQYEAFLLNESCIYSDALCCGTHFETNPNLCNVEKHYVPLTENQTVNRQIRITNKLEHLRSMPLGHDVEYKLGYSGCGLCQMQLLQKIGITHLKIVGRGQSEQFILKDIDNVKKMIRNSDLSETKFKDKVMHLFAESTCSGVCYYRNTKGVHN